VAVFRIGVLKTTRDQLNTKCKSKLYSYSLVDFPLIIEQGI